MIRAIVLDCDGVLFDTNARKSLAFQNTAKTLGCSPTVVQRLVEWQRQNFGIGRAKVFELLAEGRFGRLQGGLSVTRALEIYGQQVAGIYNPQTLVEGTVSALMGLESRHLSVASGAPESELLRAFEDCKISHHFWRISGTPKTKAAILAEQVEELAAMGVSREEIAMVGDARGDAEAARQLDVRFVFARAYSLDEPNMQKICRREGYDIVDTIEDLYRNPPQWLGP